MSELICYMFNGMFGSVSDLKMELGENYFILFLFDSLFPFA